MKKKYFENLFYTNPKNIHLQNNITKDSYCDACLDNTFCVFKTINNIIYLVYTNKNKSIIIFDIVNNKKINEIKNAHNENIRNFRYYFDRINKRDLIISISASDNNIKIWNANNFECLLNIQNINENGSLFSANIVNDNNKIYIITSNCNFEGLSESIKVYDFNGKKVKEINDSNERTFFIDSYYDTKLSNIYILTGNEGYVKSFDYINNKIYQKYSDNNDKRAHNSIIICNTGGKEDINLIESSLIGNIRIWNFHSGKLLSKIKIKRKELFGICLWNNDYLFVGCNDNSIKLIELNSGNIIKDLYEHNSEVITIKKIIHPQYGECLISQGADNDQIKLWINKN